MLWCLIILNKVSRERESKEFSGLSRIYIIIRLSDMWFVLVQEI